MGFHKRFYLQPFVRNRDTLGFSVGVDLSISLSKLELKYSCVGPIQSLQLPALSMTPARKDGLWEATCFEAFIGDAHSSRYVELNFSPSKDWQVYEFDSYRQVTGKPSAEIEHEVEVYGSDFLIQLNAILSRSILPSKDQAFDLGLSAVLEHKNGQKSYWALWHSGSKPDFHQRTGFARLEY